MTQQIKKGRKVKNNTTTATVSQIDDTTLMQRIKEYLRVNDYLTYTELIQRLNLPRKKGKSKILQLQNLERFMEFVKDGYDKTSRYLILQIYDVPIIKTRKLREDAIYTKFIQALLLFYLKQQDGHSKVMTKKKWWVQLRMVNHLYNEYSHEDKKEELLNLLPDIDINNIDEFYTRVNKRFSTIFARSLKSLADRSIINYENVYVIRYETDKQFEYHIATDAETSNILDSERYALDSVGLNTKSQLYLYPNKLKQYKQILCDYQSKKFGMIEVYSEIKITFGNKYLQREFNYSIQELDELMAGSNDVFYSNEVNEIRNKFQKTKLIQDDDDPGEIGCLFDINNPEDTIMIFGRKQDEYIFIENFIKNQMLLADTLIKVY